MFSYSIIPINKSKGLSKFLLEHKFHYIYETMLKIANIVNVYEFTF